MELRIGDLVETRLWTAAGRLQADAVGVRVLTPLKPGTILLVTDIDIIMIARGDGALIKQFICYDPALGERYSIGMGFLSLIETHTQGGQDHGIHD